MLALAAIGALGACAGAESSHQQITLITDPPGASCRLSRDEQTLLEIRAPAQFRLEKSARDAVVDCTHSGFEATHAVLTSRGRADALGMLLLAGLPAALMTLGSTGTSEYASHLYIIMMPTEFANAAARDERFGRLRSEIERQWARVLERQAKSSECIEPAKQQLCNNEMDRLKSARQTELDALETRRLAAAVRVES